MVSSMTSFFICHIERGRTPESKYPYTPHALSWPKGVLSATQRTENSLRHCGPMGCVEVLRLRAQNDISNKPSACIRVNPWRICECTRDASGLKSLSMTPCGRDLPQRRS